jgi:DHA1 family tetracycline resistance protein-like MFS transporter
MNERFLITTLCGLALLSTVGASLPYPMLAPLFADGSVHGLNSFLGLPPKLLLGIALMINPLGLLIGSAVLGPLSDGFGRRRALRWRWRWSRIPCSWRRASSPVCSKAMAP